MFYWKGHCAESPAIGERLWAERSATPGRQFPVLSVGLTISLAFFGGGLLRKLLTVTPVITSVFAAVFKADVTQSSRTKARWNEWHMRSLPLAENIFRSFKDTDRHRCKIISQRSAAFLPTAFLLCVYEKCSFHSAQYMIKYPQSGGITWNRKYILSFKY